MYNEFDSPKGELCATGAGIDRKPTAREQLARQKTALERQLADVDAALGALDANPEIEKVLTLVGRAVRF